VSWHGSLFAEGIDDGGLMYRRNRYYDPTTGRFTQEDPLGLAGGLNAYGFANGDPVNFSDPFGLTCLVKGNCTQSDGPAPEAPQEPGLEHDEVGTDLAAVGFAYVMMTGRGLVSMVKSLFSGAAPSREQPTAPLASNITRKISGQLGKRGWTSADVDQTVNSPFTTRPSTNRATGNRATAFYRKDGSYVVRDNGTGDIVQISDRKSPSTWKPDRDIQNPYRP